MSLPEEALTPTVLLVDDEPDVLNLLGRMVSLLGYPHQRASSGIEALQTLQGQSFDAVVTDIDMPGMDGLELVRRMAMTMPGSQPTVVVVSGNSTLSKAIEAMKLGADDYIQKPFLFDEFKLSLNRALERRELRQQVQAYQTRLEQMVLERTQQLQHIFINAIQSLVFALEAKDSYTNGHSHRVAWLGEKLARAAKLSDEEVEMIQIAAMFHDLGKIGVRETILLKKETLTIEERLHIQKHPEIGVKILEPIQELQHILPIVLYHHESFDGSGYPASLSGHSIPLGARVIAIVDTYDALTTDRPYRAAQKPSEAIAVLEMEAGRQFDPALIDAFVSLVHDPAVRVLLASQAWQIERPAVKPLDLSRFHTGLEPNRVLTRRDH
jgi:putative two-component system response regulator